MDRPGLALSDWSDSRHDLWIDQARVKKMAPVEQEMFANLKVVYHKGKGNDHLVPVLVPTDVAPALCLLARATYYELYIHNSYELYHNFHTCI